MSTARLTPGDQAPPLRLPDAAGATVDLTDLVSAGRRALVFVFPAAGTPGCTNETLDFQAAAGAFADAGIDILGVSPDPVAKLAAFAEKHAITFPLLSDPERSTLAEWGAYGEKKNYGRVVQGVIRSTFVVSPDGSLELARYNVRAKGHAAMIAGLVGVTLPDDESGA